MSKVENPIVYSMVSSDPACVVTLINILLKKSKEIQPSIYSGSRKVFMTMYLKK